MSTLWVREYQESAVVRCVATPIAQEPGTDQSPVSFSTSAQSAAFAAATRYIAITADAPFHYVVGADPTATTAALKVPADTLLFIGVQGGQKIAAIAAA